MFERLTRLFRRKTVTVKPLDEEQHASGIVIKDVATDKVIADSRKLDEDIELFSHSKEFDCLVQRDFPNFRKEMRIHRIAEQNLKRQKSTLGYGLKSSDFKPRPAHEKRLFDLKKKAEED